MEYIVTRGQNGHLCEYTFHILAKGKLNLDPSTLEPRWQVTGSKLLLVGKVDADSIPLNPMVN